MGDMGVLGAGLGSLPLLNRARTRSISPENPTGAKGRGGMAVPDPVTLPFSGAAAVDTVTLPPAAASRPLAAR